MSLRQFTNRDGEVWNAWNVAPNAGSGFQERYREGWVCFERVGGGGRCRLPLRDLPPAWESLPDDRLDLVRRVAQTSASTGSMPKVLEDQKRQTEDDAKARKSGPHEMMVTDETEIF